MATMCFLFKMIHNLVLYRVNFSPFHAYFPAPPALVPFFLPRSLPPTSMLSKSLGLIGVACISSNGNFFTNTGVTFQSLHH